MRPRRAHHFRAARVASWHHHGDDRRSSVLMAAVPKSLTRAAIVTIAIFSVVVAPADLKVRTTTDTPADLKVRTTTAMAAGLKARTTTATAEDPIPQRIISLVPATTEMLFAMGAGNRIAAVSGYDRFPAAVATLPRVGGLLDPNVERVISLRPDLVIVYDTQTDLKQQLDRARIPIFRYVHRGLPDIAQTMRALGERVGSKAAADQAAATMEAQLAAIR